MQLSSPSTVLKANQDVFGSLQRASVDTKLAQSRVEAEGRVPAGTKQLVDIGDSLAHQFSELARGAEPAECEALAANLDGARRHVLKLRERLMAERAEVNHD